jgi:hypothetical protein
MKIMLSPFHLLGWIFLSAMGDPIPDLVPTQFLATMTCLKFRPLSRSWNFSKVWGLGTGEE